MSRKAIHSIPTIGLLVSCLVLSGCGDPSSKLDRVMEHGEIRFALHNGPSTYYEDKDGATGLEYELAKQFAEYLGVELSLIVARNGAEVSKLLRNGQADIAAGGTIQADNPDPSRIYGPGYQWVNRQVVYRSNHRRPSSLHDIYPEKLHIARGTIPRSILKNIQAEVPSLDWQFHDDMENWELIDLVEEDEIMYAVAFSNDIWFARQSFPEIRTAFILTDPEPLAWAIKNSRDQSLLGPIEEFHAAIAEDGRLADLIDRFYGPTGFFDYVDSRTFIDKLRSRLPDLKPYFQQSADTHGIDWRLLAALSYQESHWNKHARSRTGVRGLMMLTQTTAKQLGVDNRLDPVQSIEGGTRYLHSLMERLPEGIHEPDRTWFALAAYNVGLGHLEDARVLTERDGGDPNLWGDVEQRLPLLTKRKWYKQTRYGYARGYEPVKFVRKIKKYYNVLVQLTQEDREPIPQLADSIIINSPVL